VEMFSQKTVIEQQDKIAPAAKALFH